MALGSRPITRVHQGTDELRWDCLFDGRLSTNRICGCVRGPGPRPAPCARPVRHRGEAVEEEGSLLACRDHRAVICSPISDPNWMDRRKVIAIQDRKSVV